MNPSSYSFQPINFLPQALIQHNMYPFLNINFPNNTGHQNPLIMQQFYGVHQNFYNQVNTYANLSIPQNGMNPLYTYCNQKMFNQYQQNIIQKMLPSYQKVDPQNISFTSKQQPKDVEDVIINQNQGLPLTEKEMKVKEEFNQELIINTVQPQQQSKQIIKQESPTEKKTRKYTKRQKVVEEESQANTKPQLQENDEPQKQEEPSFEHQTKRQEERQKIKSELNAGSFQEIEYYDSEDEEEQEDSNDESDPDYTECEYTTKKSTSNKKRKRTQKSSSKQKFHNMAKLCFNSLLTIFTKQYLEQCQLREEAIQDIKDVIQKIKNSGKKFQNNTYKTDLYCHSHYNIAFLIINQNNISMLKPKDIELHKACFDIDLSNKEMDLHNLEKINQTKENIFKIVEKYMSQNKKQKSGSGKKVSVRDQYWVRAMNGIRQLAQGIKVSRF